MHALLFFIDFFPLPLPLDMAKSVDSEYSEDELLIENPASASMPPPAPKPIDDESSEDELLQPAPATMPRRQPKPVARESSTCELVIGPYAVTPPLGTGNEVPTESDSPSLDHPPPTLSRGPHHSSNRSIPVPLPGARATSQNPFQPPPSRSPSPVGPLIGQPTPPIMQPTPPIMQPTPPIMQSTPSNNVPTPTTPRSKTALPKLAQTPGNRGSSSQFDYEEHFHRESVDVYIDEDLKSSRVFLPADIFLQVLLGLPRNWEKDDTFTNLIVKVLCDKAYAKCRDHYRKVCLQPPIKHENLLYDDYLDMCNIATGIFVDEDGSDASESLWTYRQDNNRLLGSKADRSPDGQGVSLKLWKTSGNKMRTGKGPKNNFGWPQGQYFIDLKRFRYLLDRGSSSPYAVLDIHGRDPRDMKEVNDAGDRHEKRTGISSGTVRNTKKRASRSAAGMPSAKRSKTQSAISAMLASGGETVSSTNLGPDDDSQNRRGVSRQCARYALEVLSSAGFRSHCFGLLIGINEIQIIYYDRSIIAVSQPFPMVNLKSRTGLDCINERRFVALLLCLHRATLAQRGIMVSLMPDPFLELYKDYTKKNADDPKTLFEGQKIKLLVDGKEVSVKLGRIVMRQPGIIGRNTCVVAGTSDAWPGMDLVVKISWPASSRVSENTFVEQIKAAAEAQEDAAWVLDHIPTILHSQDFPLQSDSPGTRLQAYLSGPDVKFVDDKAFHYEHRVCRVSVHERLHHLDTLKKPQDYAQVIFDVFQVHRWIYDNPRIIHRDLSQGNIMWHERNGRIRGVLNDFDLSSPRDAIGASSKQRTGTRPFMAHELHQLAVNGQPPIHLYRHDVESIFYIIVLLACAHRLRKEPDTDGSYLRADKSSVLREWFSMTDNQLYDKKCNVIANLNGVSIPVPARSFQGFTGWIQDMHARIKEGVLDKAKAALKAAQLKAVAPPADEGEYDDETDDEMDQAQAAAPPAETDEDEDMDMAVDAVAAFDNETLDGAISYDAILDIMKTFAKDGTKPRSLVVMYPIAKAD